MARCPLADRIPTRRPYPHPPLVPRSTPRPPAQPDLPIMWASYSGNSLKQGLIGQALRARDR